MKSILICILLFAQATLGQRLTTLVGSNSIRSEMFKDDPMRGMLSHELLAQVQLDGVSPSGAKNVGLAVVYSLLLPGMGELYTGEYGVGKYFTIAEGTLWLALGGLHWSATWLQDDARAFAAQHAQVNLNDKDDQYYIDIGNFENVYAFNEQVLRDRDAHKVYDPNSSAYWSWDTDANRETYRELRVSTDERFNDTRFVAAAIAVNHFISAVNAARLALSHNKSVQESELLNIHASIMGGLANPHGVMISFSKSF